MAQDEANYEKVEMPDYPPMDETGTIDIWQLKALQALTPQERMRQFEGFVELFAAFREAGRKYYGELPPIDPEAP